MSEVTPAAGEHAGGTPADATGRALVIVPTYNERENISRLIEQVLAQDPRLDVLQAQRAPQRERVADRARFVERRDDRHVADRTERRGERSNPLGPIAVVVGDQNQRHEVINQVYRTNIGRPEVYVRLKADATSE